MLRLVSVHSGSALGSHKGRFQVIAGSIFWGDHATPVKDRPVVAPKSNSATPLESRGVALAKQNKNVIYQFKPFWEQPKGCVAWYVAARS